MRKLTLVLMMIFALSVFTVFAVAQTPGGTTGNSAQGGTDNTNANSNNSSAPVTGATTDPAMVNGDQSRNAAHSSNSNSSTSSDASSGEKTLDGCVVKEQSDYFIQPASGERE